jgi:hypothetical protein
VRRLFAAPRRSAATALVLATMAGAAMGARAYAAPPTSNEIRIGVTAPYTGPASAYGVIAKVMLAYMDKVNAEGGINGRKINMITYDDGYEPTKVMEATRKLVEEDQVLFTMAAVGTNTNAAIQPYLNSKKVPQLFVLSGAAPPGKSSAQPNRGSLPGRRDGQGIPEGPEGRPGRQDSDRGRGAVQGHRRQYRRAAEQAESIEC